MPWDWDDWELKNFTLFYCREKTWQAVGKQGDLQVPKMQKALREVPWKKGVNMAERHIHTSSCRNR